MFYALYSVFVCTEQTQTLQHFICLAPDIKFAAVFQVLGMRRDVNIQLSNFSITILLSVYSPFSERVGLHLHNIPSPFLPVMHVFSVDL